MKKPNNIQAWIAQTRANFLFLAIFLVAIGLAYAAKYETDVAFNWFHAILIMLGTISAHISVNLFNEYSDFRTRIDFHTEKTPFSGGSNMLPTGVTQPAHVRLVAWSTLLFAAAIGIYFSIVSHYSIAIIAIIGAIAITLYTPILSKLLLGELFSGLALGSLVVIGAYIAMNATPGASIAGLVPVEVWLISITPGILTALLLLLNEFPDADADKAGGRKHLVIVFGRKTAAWMYTAGILISFAVIILLPLFGIASFWLYLALLPLPVGLKASITAIKYSNDMKKIVPAMGMNVIVVLATDLLIAVSVMITL